MENYTEPPAPTRNLEVDINAKTTLLDIGKWAFGLAAISIIVAAAFLLFTFIVIVMGFTEGAFHGDKYSLAAIWIMAFASMASACTLIYPVYALIKYNTQMKLAVSLNDADAFHSALLFIKKLFRYYVVTFTISAAFYLLALVIIGTIAAAMNS